MNVTPLKDLGASYLEFTKTPGALRCLQSGDDVKRAQGLYFLCPKCEKPGHGITLLFDLESVPEKAQPHGRWKASGRSLLELTLDDRVQSPTECGWVGVVSQGKVKW